MIATAARSIGLFVLLLPVAAAAARTFRSQGDRALALLAGGAAAVCTLVTGGLLLSSFSGVNLTMNTARRGSRTCCARASRRA